MCKHANSAGQSLEMTWREDFGILGEASRATMKTPFFSNVPKVGRLTKRHNRDNNFMHT